MPIGNGEHPRLGAKLIKGNLPHLTYCFSESLFSADGALLGLLRPMHRHTCA